MSRATPPVSLHYPPHLLASVSLPFSYPGPDQQSRMRTDSCHVKCCSISVAETQLSSTCQSLFTVAGVVSRTQQPTHLPTVELPVLLTCGPECLDPVRGWLGLRELSEHHPTRDKPGGNMFPWTWDLTRAPQRCDHQMVSKLLASANLTISHRACELGVRCILEVDRSGVAVADSSHSGHLPADGSVKCRIREQWRAALGDGHERRT